MTQRKIMFRGLRVDGKGWVYGCLVNNLWARIPQAVPIYEIIPDKTDFDPGDWCEVEEIAVEVLPETVGQYIKDIHIEGEMVPVFEHDILRKPTGYIYEANFKMWQIGPKNMAYGFGIGDDDIIIGNSIQHPELLK